MNDRLKESYEDHVQNSVPEMMTRVKFRIGQVVRHNKHGYRAVVIGWNFQHGDNQMIEILPDHFDANEFMDQSFLFEKKHHLSSDDFVRVDDPELMRIYNDSIPRCDSLLSSL